MLRFFHNVHSIFVRKSWISSDERVSTRTTKQNQHIFMEIESSDGLNGRSQNVWWNIRLRISLLRQNDRRSNVTYRIGVLASPRTLDTLDIASFNIHSVSAASTGRFHVSLRSYRPAIIYVPLRTSDTVDYPRQTRRRELCESYADRGRILHALQVRLQPESRKPLGFCRKSSTEAARDHKRGICCVEQFLIEDPYFTERCLTSIDNYILSVLSFLHSGVGYLRVVKYIIP